MLKQNFFIFFLSFKLCFNPVLVAALFCHTFVRAKGRDDPGKARLV